MDTREKPFDATQAINDMDGGVYVERVSRALRDVAKAVADQDETKPKKGQVTLTFDLSKIGNSRQVEVAHDVKYSLPTRAGKRVENHTTTTPMHVNLKGHLLLFPESQGDFFPKQREPIESE